MDYNESSHVVLVVKNLPANEGDIRDKGLIPGLGRSPGGGHGSPLQYSCLEYCHRAAQSQTHDLVIKVTSTHVAHWLFSWIT